MAVARGLAPAMFGLLAGCNIISGADNLTTSDPITSSSRRDARSEASSPLDERDLDSGVVDDASPAEPSDAVVDAGPHRRVFVTSSSWSGNLGGLSGADERCNTLASTASLGGEWVAWLSLKETSALERLTSAGPWYLVDDTPAVRSMGDLQNDTLAHAINRNENGGVVSNDGVWTGTRAGKFELSDCNGWKSASSAQGGTSGLTGSATATWTANIPDGCSASNRLYCFEK